MFKARPSQQKTFKTFSVRPKKKRFSFQMILGVVLFFIVAIGAMAGFYLSQTNQDTRQQAAGTNCSDTPGNGCKVGSCGSGYEAASGSCPFLYPPLVCCRKKPVPSPSPIPKPSPVPAPTPNCPQGSLWSASLLACRCDDGSVISVSGSCSVGGILCPAGASVVGNQCKCNVSGANVDASDSCVAKTCPVNSTPILTGSNIGSCRCVGGPITLPTGTCPIGTCQARGNICQSGSTCAEGYESASGGCIRANQVCCKPKPLPKPPETCPDTAGNTCVSGACPLGKISGVGTCNAGSVCCKPDPGMGCEQLHPNNVCQVGVSCREGFTNATGPCRTGYTCCKPKTCAQANGTCTLTTNCAGNTKPAVGTCPSGLKCCQNK